MNKDLAYGLLNETKCFEILKQKFDEKLEKTRDKHSIFDFESDEYLIELKSRRNTKNKYLDTMVGKNKIDYALTSSKKVVFAFLFTDGLYYWEYDKDSNAIEFRQGGRWDRGRPEIKDYAFINTSVLVAV